MDAECLGIIESICIVWQNVGILVYDMSMHEYNFELEGEYCETNINNYFQSKEEKRQKELRDSKYKFWK